MIKYIVLGIIQGLTEFLPISSSGHLVIAQRFLTIDNAIAFDVTVHLATLLAVVLYFRKDLLEISRWVLVAFYKMWSDKISFKEIYERVTFFKLACLIFLSFLITSIIGFTFKDIFESLFSSVKLVGIFLIINGLMLSAAEKFSKATKDLQEMDAADASIIGLAQAISIIPAISRSGATISAGLFRGIDREVAARYSFLLSIPTIFAAGILESRNIASVGDIRPLLLGGFAAFISGYFAIHYFIKFISKNSLHPFAVYCIILGLATLILL